MQGIRTHVLRSQVQMYHISVAMECRSYTRQKCIELLKYFDAVVKFAQKWVNCYKNISLNPTKIMTETSDNQANPPKKGKIDIVVIGDIVFDKITINEKNEDLLERDSCGGALFVKTFFEADPCIAESSSIYGYDYIDTPNDEPDIKIDDKPEKSPSKNLYNKIIQKTINLIPLNKQKTENSGNVAYRMQGPITKLKDDKGSVTLSFPSISPDQENNNLQFLVVTDLGISTNPDQNNDKQSAPNQDPVWIGNRKIELEEASKDEEHEWIHHLRRAYDINHNLDSGSMPWHFVTISNPTDKLFESSSYSYLKNHNDTMNGQEELFNDEEISVINKKTLAILFGDHLRSRCDLAIARRISIERTAQDFFTRTSYQSSFNGTWKF